MLRVRWQHLVAVGAFILVLSRVFAQPTIRPRREITLTTESVPLSVQDRDLVRTGALRFRGGLAIHSEDPGFGGLSGLSVEAAGAVAGDLSLLAVSDEGSKFTAQLHIRDGRLDALDHATLEPLLTLEGRPIAGKAWGDAESVSRLPDGRVLVGFERQHRIWAYGPGLTGKATVFMTPPELLRAPSNGGLESVANWPDGRVLALTEQMRTSAGNLAGFLLKDGAWSRVEWQPSEDGFEASDATVSPEGDLLVLERRWSALAPMDLRSRISRVRSDAVKPGATLQGELLAELKAPLTTENFEGIATFRTASGPLQILMVSDDNFSRAQRTLLMWFEMSAN